MMCEACAEKVTAQGGLIQMGRKVVGLDYSAGKASWTVTHEGVEGTRQDVRARHVISSAPLRSLVRGLTPAPSEPVRRAADLLRYRDFLTVVLIVRGADRFTDNWIYIHDPDVKVGRVQNFKSWSPEMVPDPAMNCYGLEYFCFEGDELWAANDALLIER